MPSNFTSKLVLNKQTLTFWLWLLGLDYTAGVKICNTPVSYYGLYKHKSRFQHHFKQQSYFENLDLELSACVIVGTPLES